MTCPRCKDYLGKCPACGGVPKAVIDYPADIMKAAEHALDTLLCNCAESCGGTEQLHAASVKEIAKVILAERKVWKPIEEAKRNHSVILCSWWKSNPSNPFIYEGYLDIDGTNWLVQDGAPLPSHISAPTHFMDMPAPPLPMKEAAGS